MPNIFALPLSPVANEIGEIVAIPYVPDLPDPHLLLLKANLQGETLSIDLLKQRAADKPSRQASFRFDSPTSEVIVDDAGGLVDSVDHPPIAHAQRRFTGIRTWAGLAAVTSPEAAAGFPILHTGAAMQVTTLNQYYYKPLAAPFFVGDSRRSYYVACQPATTTVMRAIKTPSAASPPLGPSIFSSAALQTTVTLTGAAVSDPSPWIRAKARTLSYASAAAVESMAEPPLARTMLSPALAQIIDARISLGMEPVTVSTVSTTFTPFFHPFVGDFTTALNKYGLDGLFSLEIQGLTLADRQPFKARYAPDPERVTNADLVEAVDFSAGSPFGVHNTELFLHLPLMLQAIQVQNGRPDLGLAWGSRVLDLLGAETDPADAWKYLPFRQDRHTPSFGELLDALSGPADDPRRGEALAQIEASQLYPFQPFRIARLRPDAMKKYAFLQVFNARFELADQHFARYTPEDVSIALMHYLVLEAALGPRPEVLPAQMVPDKTYAELRPHLDAAGDAVLTVESKLGALAAMTAPVASPAAQSTRLRLTATRYFGLSPNAKLLELWDKVADRLHKIRNGLTIDGVRRPLPVFGPRIDPGMLVQAAAAGTDLSSAAAAAGGVLRPSRRFPTLLRMARERIERLNAINAALLSTLKEKDAEKLAAMRTRHEGEMMVFIGESRQLQVEEAQRALPTLRAQRDAAMIRWRNFRQQLGFDDLAEPKTNMDTGEVEETGQREATRAFRLVEGASGSITLTTPTDPTGTTLASARLEIQAGRILDREREELLMSFGAAAAQGLSAHLEAVAGLLKVIPMFEAAVKPLGLGAAVAIGGPTIAAISEAAAKEASGVASLFGFLSTAAGRQATFLWRERDFALQLNLAAADALHIDQQIIAAQKTLNVRLKEQQINAEQAERNAQVLEFLKGKFSNEDFYLTMIGQLTALQKQAWTAALDKLNEARTAFAFDFTPGAVPPLPPNLWEAPKGLLSGEALALAAHQLESAYVAADKGRLELTRNFSLKQVNPFALMRLRETGSCQFSLPEALFDLDNPGHLNRRIVSVRLSIPAVAGPYAPVHATLRLVESSVRISANETIAPELPPGAAIIVTSTGRDDSGQFQSGAADDRYGPFEGGGAHSTFQIDLPKEFRQFPYRTMADIIVTLQFRADPGGPPRPAPGAAIDAMQLEAARNGAFQLLSLRYDFPEAWRIYERAPDRPIKIRVNGRHLPYPFRNSQVTSGLVLWAKPDIPVTEEEIRTADSVTVTGGQAVDDIPTWELAFDAAGPEREEAYIFVGYKLA